MGNKASKPLAVKFCGFVAAGETPSLTWEIIEETHSVLECTQKHPPGNQHQKNPICLWVAGEVTESWLRAKQGALFPLRPLPHIQHHVGRPTLGDTYSSIPYKITIALRQKKYGPHRRTYQSSRNSCSWCGSVDWVPDSEPKDCRFNSQSGYMPELQARFPA